jgi:NAD(P)-dependent dehydrogenase (short-subunit alcohol dehydrogenase family)
VAEALAGAGYRVFGSVRAADARVPDGVERIELDVRSDASVERAAREIVERAGRIDVLVNNAGGALVGAIEETDTAQAQALFDVNFFGAARMTRAVLPVMRKAESGRIVFISSVVGFLPAPFMAYYAASKHALEGYAESLDHELRGFGVRALLVEPGFMKTKIDRNSSQAAHPLDAYRAARERAAAGIQASVEAGDDPALVAAVVLEAVRARAPSLRYTVGKGAGLLAALRRFMPAGAFDRSLRREFKLDAAS